MRVAMLTPMAQDSAIADVMLQAVPDLAREWDLEVWYPPEPNPRPCPVPARSFGALDSDALAELAEFDLVIYVLGDSPFHAPMLPFMRRVPGLVVLHDASITNLVRTAAVRDKSLDAVVSEVEELHGEEAAEILRVGYAPGGPLKWLEFCAQVPLDQIALQRSLGAVVHSQWHARRVDGMSLGEVTVAPLPVPTSRMREKSERARGPIDKALAALDPADLLVVTVGHVNANRLVDEIVSAAADLESERLHVWAVGHVESSTRAELRRRAVQLGLGDRFLLTGRVDDALLADVLGRADIAVALRTPVLEGQSASVLTQMGAGLPAIVLNHGHYAELPDDAVLKVDPDNVRHGLVQALQHLAQDPDERAARGAAAREYVGQRSGSAYAEAILVAAERALAARPMTVLAADLNRRLERIGLHRQPAVVDLVSDFAFELFELG